MSIIRIHRWLGVKAYNPREDLITLQNPHALPSSSVPLPLTKNQEKVQTTSAKPLAAGKATAAKAKADVPCAYNSPITMVKLTLISGNISPYSTGLPGASLTSTSVDPQLSSSKLVWDEVWVLIAQILFIHC